MKKYIALILALLMLASALCACGENPSSEPVQDEPEISSDEPKAEIILPEDEDEGDKEAVEIVPPEVTLTPTNPTEKVPAAPETPTVQQTPVQQTPASQEKPKTPAQTQEKPQAPAAQNTKFPVPVSTQTPFGTAPDPTFSWKTYTMILWGDAYTCSNSMGDIMNLFANADGFKLKVLPISYIDHGTAGTYNFYEMFSFDDANSKTPTATGFKKKCLEDYLTDKTPEDFFVVLGGRNRVLSQTNNNAEKACAGAKLAFDLMKKHSPNAKGVYITPSAYKEGFPFYEKYAMPKNTTPASHKQLIDAYAQKFMANMGENALNAKVGDAFEYFEKNYASSGIALTKEYGVNTTMAGSYYMAAIIYETIFGKSTVGMTGVDAYLDSETAATLRKAAHEFYFGTDASTVKRAKGSMYDNVFFPGIVDPRIDPNRDPRFKDEVYPANYDVIMSTYLAYYIRQDMNQYDNKSYDLNKGRGYRVGTSESPEDATPQTNVYLDCISIAAAAYKDTFGYDFDRAVYCKDYVNNEKIRVFFWDGSSNDTPIEKVKEELLASLQPGDCIVYDCNQKAGHLCTYMGNGQIIHSTGNMNKTGGGSAYIFTQPDDVFERGLDCRELGGTVHICSIDRILNENDAFYPFFHSGYRVAVVRPLSLDLKPNQNAINRLNGMFGVIAYKLTTASEGITASPGSDVTLTFVVQNGNAVEKTVELKDTLPKGVSFKSGDVKHENGSISASVTVAPYTQKTVSFTVTVDANASGVIEWKSATANGVLLNSTDIYVGNTLTKDEQAKVAAAAKTVKTASDSLDFAKQVYTAALGKTLDITNLQSIYSSIYTKDGDYNLFNESASNPVKKMVACRLFGGKGISNASGFSYTAPYNYRTEDLKLDKFVPGDLIFVTKDPSKPGQIYIYLGNNRVATYENGYRELNNAETGQFVLAMFDYFAYAVLRPSLIF